MSWFQIWTIAWQVAVFLTPLLLGCAVLWLKAQFIGKPEFNAEVKRAGDRHDKLKDDLSGHETRLQKVEEYIARPSSQHKLANEMGKLQGEIHVLGKTVDGLARQTEQQSSSLGRQLDTLHSYLHTLVEKGLS